MDDELARRVHELLREAVQLDGDARREFIESECRNDSRLSRRTTEMLSLLDVSEQFLDRPAMDRARGALDAVIPEQIGNYRVVRRLGSGGMATVYEAIQADPERRVALKLPRYGWLDSSAIHRFRYETQLLARLQHPNIAQVYEGGIWEPADGLSTPYFVMEFVPDARSIIAYADEHALAIDARLELFSAVCDAVHHAHQVGIFHRDLKPANILVSADGRAKVIDFGVARSADEVEAREFAATHSGRVIGSLNYMSPEQCCAGTEVDARTDVYSLGCVLYELLCGYRPHDFSDTPVVDALRIIQDVDPASPASVERRLRGDLNAIILKAMQKSRERRYQSVDVMRRDIQRYLNHETVDARTPSAAYHFLKFARRYRGLVLTVTAALVVIVASLFCTGVFAYRMWLETQRRMAAEIRAIEERDAAVWQQYRADIAGAISAYQMREYRQMRDRLASAPASHRDWEWRYLDGLAQLSQLTVTDHPDRVLDMVANRQRTRMATVCYDGTVTILNMNDGSLIATVNPLERDLSRQKVGASRAVAFSHDGLQVFTGSDDGVLRVWDADTGRLLKQFAKLGSRVQSVTTAPGGLLASATLGGVAYLWDAEGRQRAKIDDHNDKGQGTQDKIHGVLFSDDGQWLVTWNDAGDVRLRKTDGLDVLLRWQFPSQVRRVAIRPGNDRIAIGDFSGMVVVFELPSGEVIQQRPAPNGSPPIESLTFSHDGQTLAVGRNDRVVEIWSVEDASQTGTITGHEEAVSGLVFTADDSKLFTASWDRTVRTWDVNEAVYSGDIGRLKHRRQVTAVAFSPDGQLLASGGLDGEIRLSDPVLQTPLATLRGGSNGVMDLCFSPTESILAGASLDGRVRMWDVLRGEQVAELMGHRGAVWTVRFSPDGGRLVSGGDDNVLRVWDVASHALLHTLPGHENRVTCAAFSPDGNMIASSSRDHTVRLWDAGSGECLHCLSGHTSDVFAVLFDQQGQHLYSGSRDQTVRIWETATGVCRATLDGHGQFVTGLSLNAAGNRLAAGSLFGAILLWDVPTSDLVATFSEHGWPIPCVQFSPDGSILAFASHDRSAHLMDAISYAEQSPRREHAKQQMAVAQKIADELFQSHHDVAAVIRAAENNEIFDAEATNWLRKAIAQRNAPFTSEAGGTAKNNQVE